MTVDEFLSDKDRVIAYNKWINSETGIMVCAVLSTHFLRPILPGQFGQKLDEASASFCLGENSGSWKMYDGLRDLGKLKEIAPEQIDETYETTDVTDEREPQGDK